MSFTKSINTHLLKDISFDEIIQESHNLTGLYHPMRTRLGDLKITIVDNTLIFCCHDQKLTLTNWALGQFCQLIGIPKKYLIACSENDYFNLVYHNINVWLNHNAEKDITLLVYGDCIHGFVTQRYLRISHENILRVVQNNKGFNEQYRLASYTQSPEYLHIRFINNEPFMTDHTGSPLFVGYYIQNSEVGCSSLYVDTFIYRQVCTNGLTVPKFSKSFYKKHVGSQYDLSGLDFSLHSILAAEDNTAARELITKSQNSTLGYEAAVNYLKSQKLNESNLLQLTPVSYSSNGSCEYSLFDFINVITDHAKNHGIQNRLKAEAYAGSILQNHIG